MKYFYPIHFDGGNRGCEAIARSTAQLVGLQPAEQIAYCRDVELDTRLGLARCLTLMPARLDSYLADRCLAALYKFFPSGRTFAWRKNYPYRSLLRLISPGDRVLFTGGDMLCYGNNEIITLNDELHRRGVATILWGCSMGPENLTPEKRRTLDHFSLIYARESLTCEFFLSLGLSNIVLLPDPAFVLQPEHCQLPDCFDSAEVIGINISSYVMGGVGRLSPFARAHRTPHPARAPRHLGARGRESGRPPDGVPHHAAFRRQPQNQPVGHRRPELQPDTPRHLPLLRIRRSPNPRRHLGILHLCARHRPGLLHQVTGHRPRLGS